MSKTKPMYYVYHIPKIKIGMTKDLGDRVFEQQGYEPEEVELLFDNKAMNLKKLSCYLYQEIWQQLLKKK